jgi:hypothetical protein
MKDEDLSDSERQAVLDDLEVGHSARPIATDRFKSKVRFPAAFYPDPPKAPAGPALFSVTAACRQHALPKCQREIAVAGRVPV